MTLIAHSASAALAPGSLIFIAPAMAQAGGPAVLPSVGVRIEVSYAQIGTRPAAVLSATPRTLELETDARIFQMAYMSSQKPGWANVVGSGSLWQVTAEVTPPSAETQAGS
ncbi:hypothetical protein [Brevundimonas subvibrioides]|uniref:hypothetical protein n=1 Tax=Brevundimonas subvibrioides TaxID=74313 RepID=UPI0032D5762C